jgi:hypothetical protein
MQSWSSISPSVNLIISPAGVIDDHYLPGARQPGRENQRPDRVVVDHGAEVPDRVDIGSSETQHLPDAGEPGIRTSDDRDLGADGAPRLRS